MAKNKSVVNCDELKEEEVDTSVKQEKKERYRRRIRVWSCYRNWADQYWKSIENVEILMDEYKSVYWNDKCKCKNRSALTPEAWLLIASTCLDMFSINHH